jgi:hypothetical protein
MTQNIAVFLYEGERAAKAFHAPGCAFRRAENSGESLTGFLLYE